MSIIEIVSFVAIIAFLIFIHELGHFLGAKLSGVWVQEFAIGMPPRFWSKVVNQTRYSLGMLPIGGYVKLYGEDSLENDVPPDAPGKPFVSQPNWLKLWVLSAGVFMNYLFGVVLLAVILGIAGMPERHFGLRVSDIVEDSPAEASALEVDNFIIGYKSQADESFRSIESTETFVSFIQNNLGNTVELQVTESLTKAKREAEPEVRTVAIEPAPLLAEDRGSLGVEIGLATGAHYQPVRWYAIPGLAVRESVELVGLMFDGLRQLGASMIRGIIPEDVSGVVGAGALYTQIADLGIVPVLQFIALISINLAVVNLLPIPALDGGRIFFVLAEIITGRSLNDRVQQAIHLVGFIVLIGLMIAITVNDVLRLI